MASGYRASNGADLDDVFDSYVRGSKPAATGYHAADNGQDLNQRYAPIAFGSAAAATQFRLANGDDLNTLWAAKGSAVYWDGSLADLPEFESDGGSGSFEALVDIIFFPSGEIKIRQNYPIANTLIGRWDGQVADSSNTEIRFVVTDGSLDGNSATSFRPLTARQNFFISVPAFSGFETKVATVRVELQLKGDSSTRLTRSISIRATYSHGGGGTD